MPFDYRHIGKHSSNTLRLGCRVGSKFLTHTISGHSPWARLGKPSKQGYTKSGRATPPPGFGSEQIISVGFIQAWFGPEQIILVQDWYGRHTVTAGPAEDLQGRLYPEAESGRCALLGPLKRGCQGFRIQAPRLNGPEIQDSNFKQARIRDLNFI